MTIIYENEIIYNGIDYPHVGIGATLDRDGGELVIITREITDIETGERMLTARPYSKKLERKLSPKRNINIFAGYFSRIAGGDLAIFNRNKTYPKKEKK